MSDIVERLRAWVYTDSLYATAREAADEIERLRLSAGGDCPASDKAAKPDRLTDAEREAVSECYEWSMVADHRSLAATLRGLLERLGGGDESRS